MENELKQLAACVEAFRRLDVAEAERTLAYLRDRFIETRKAPEAEVPPQAPISSET